MLYHLSICLVFASCLFEDGYQARSSRIVVLHQDNICSVCLLLQALSLGVVEAPAGLTKKHLPRHVDYRGTGADATVKDQATCGSCWVSRADGCMGPLCRMSDQHFLYVRTEECLWQAHPGEHVALSGLLCRTPSRVTAQR